MLSHATAERSTSARSRISSTAGWLHERLVGPMPEGAVVLHAPSPVFQAPGGGENQLIQTGRHLERIGVAVRPFNSWTDRLRDARLIHLFGMSREGLAMARLARTFRVPVVLSTICWIEPRAIAALAPNPLRTVWDLAKWTAKGFLPRRLGWRSELLSLADAILPNSWVEARQLVRLFGARKRSIHVVPNGVEPRFAEGDPSLFREHIGHDEFLLYVGRIEPRKNVLGLVKAARMASKRLVVIGEVVPGHEDYAERCRREGGDLVMWLPRVEHDDPLLASAYASARVFALPSWFETPGLAALEAALAGCPVVLTPYGCTVEYFGNRVRYAHPNRPAEIARAVEDSWSGGAALGLADHVESHFLWSNVAQKTAEVYDRLVAP